MQTKRKKPWADYLPTHVRLYHVDINDSLDSHDDIVAECVERNALTPIVERIDWLWDFPEQQYLDEIKRKMRFEYIEWNDEWDDEIREWLFEHDTSEPVGELLLNTSSFNCYFDLGYHVDEPYGADEEEQEEEIEGICEILGIPKGSRSWDKIKSIYYNASYGGRLRIYFPSELESLISKNVYDSQSEDFKTIIFKGKYRVAIIDTAQGSGDFEDDVELDVEYKFDRACLGVSQTDNYGFEEIFGDSCGIRDCETPRLSMTENKYAKVIESEELRELREREKRFKRTFEQGRCTYGDIKMERHRDVEYRNQYPCGWVCPHCGMFWID